MFLKKILGKDGKIDRLSLTKALLLLLVKAPSNNSIFTHKFFKDSKNRKPLLQCLCRLSMAPNLTPKDKEQLLSLFDSKSGREGAESTLEYISLINSLLVLGESEKLTQNKIDSLEALETTLTSSFEAFIGKLPNVSNLAMGFSNSFALFRKPNSLFIYASTLSQLDEPDKTICLNALKIFIEEVMLNQFHGNRYKGEHFDMIERHLDSDAMTAWKAGEAMQYSELSGEEPEGSMVTPIDSGEFDYQSYFYQQIVTDAHLHNENFKYLVDYLKAAHDNNEQEMTKQKNLINREQNKHTITQPNKNKQQLQQLQLSSLIIGLIESKDTSTQKKKAQLSNIKQLLDKMDENYEIELHKHIDGLLNPIKLSRFTGYTVADTDDPCDLLLLGTEVAGSCQRVDGNPDLNKGLLGYLLDGAHRAIVIKKPDGTIVARTLLRLLWDEKENKAVLFQARIYPDNTPKALENALVAMAKHRAEALGVTLVGSIEQEKASLDLYPNALQLVSSRSPYNYVDACRGVQGSSGYTITGASFPVLHKPRPLEHTPEPGVRPV